jgi:hypothetical protein
MQRKILFLFILLLWAQPVVTAQSPPGYLKNLQVELWPEYDRPETLIIYRGELESTTALPVPVTLRLPGYLEDFHVVATEQNGVLVEVERESIEWRKEDDTRLLTFSTSAPGIHVEYYDPQILTKQGQQRQLRFDFVSPYAVETATFQIQEPVQTEAFSMTPPPTSSFTGNDGLKYNVVEIAGLAGGEVFSLSASYNRSTDELSAGRLQSGTAEHAPDLSTTTETPPADNLMLGYVLIGVGVVLLLSVGAYWWWSTRMKPAIAQSRPRARRSPAHPRRQHKPGPGKTTGQPQTSAPAELSSNFCYRCGTPLRDDSNFCHICGAERRR